MPAQSFQWTIRDYLQVVLHRKWLFIIPLLVSVIVAAVIARVLPRIYRSYGTILVEEKRISNPLIEHIAVSRSIGDKMNVVRSQIFSQSYLEEIIKDMRLKVDYNNRVAMARAIGELRRQIKVEVPSGQMIRVVCEREDAKEAKEITEYLIDRLIEENFRLQEWEVQSALKFIDAQMDIYNRRLEQSDIIVKGWEDIMSLNWTPSPQQNIGMLQALPGMMNIDSRKAVQFESNLIEIGIEKQLTEDKLHELQKRLNGEDDEIVLTTAKNDPLLGRLLTEVFTKQAELDALLIDSTEEHPGVVKLRTELVLLKSQIEGQRKKRIEYKDYAGNPAFHRLKDDIKETARDLEQLKLREEKFTEWVSKYRERFTQLPAEQLRKMKLMRDYSVDLNIYTLLKQKRETALLTQRLDIDEKGTRFRLLDPPQVPLAPIRPNVNMIILLGAIMGACIGSGLIFASEFADHSFRDVTEARRYLDLPILGSISYIESKNQRKKMSAARKYAGIIVVILFILFITLLAGF